MLRTRMTILLFLLLALSTFVILDSDYPLISCPLCKIFPLEYFMILGRNVEQDQMKLCTRMTTLPFFWSYLPLLYLTMIIH